MIDVMDVLRRWSAGHSDRKIARVASVDRKTAAPLTKLNALPLTAAEHQTHDYYMNIGPLFADPVARQLYAEIASIENLKSHTFAPWNPFAGQLHSRGMDLVGRHQDRSPAPAGFVGNFRFLQEGNYLCGLSVVELPVEQ